ncbi:MAG: prepilin-type N-terminal cleavage/methylation domain-containing protein [Rhodoferax sp.]|nr:MAG: prepilin-type N-terminal cleavage/methylation domain-containing protein [Rhodoferax sp.]
MNRYTVRKHIGVQFARGFTLVELVMVMVLLGILAAYAAPRIFNRSDFDARGLHDVTMAYLRYAQKTAIAQRRQVCVAYTANSLTLTIAAAAGTGACPGAAALNGPDGKTSLAAPANVSYSPVPATVAFDALGQPLDSNGAVLVASRTVTVTGSGRTITVEAATGYVHD